MNNSNPIKELSFQFALQIIEYCETLESSRKYVIGNQLLKSGTSIGANIREAQNAESINDFLHKMKIAMKEVEETSYWLELCEMSANYPSSKHLSQILSNIERILAKIIITTKEKITTQKATKAKP
jgi:four helix bundle protein